LAYDNDEKGYRWFFDVGSRGVVRVGAREERDGSGPVIIKERVFVLFGFESWEARRKECQMYG
jgi:hypothetical protein